MMKKYLKYSFIWLIVGIAIACQEAKKSNRQYDNNLLTIAADESYKPVLDQLSKTYIATMAPQKTIKVQYLPEEEAISLILKDSVRLIFTSRQLTEQEQKVFKNGGFSYKPYPIATDGIALITSRINKDTLLTLNQLEQIFKGDISTWKQLSGNSNAKITLVFDNANSTNLRFIMNKFGITDVKNLTIFAAGSNEKVIEYVREHPDALGFIGVNWISDGESVVATRLSSGLNILGLSDKAKATKSDYFQPFQRDIGTERYPLHRKIYILTRDSKYGFGSDFINYIIRDVGSLIIEKCGLWAHKPANREVNID